MIKPVCRNDIRLIPYSPAYERDTLEIRVQVFGTEDGKMDIPFYLDDEVVGNCEVDVKAGEYSLAKCYLPLAGKAGIHTVTVLDATVDLRVLGEEPLPILDSGMLMLGPPNDRDACDFYRDAAKSYTDEQWARYIEEMAKIGITCFVIMVTHQFLTLEKRDVAAHYPSKIHPKSDMVAEDAIGTILATAEKMGLHVFLGIGNMYGHRATTEEVKELLDRYDRYESFYGWYLAEEHTMEILGPVEIERWRPHKEIIQYIRTICPVKPVLASPFSAPNDMFAEHVVNKADIDIYMPQDQCCSSYSPLEFSYKIYKDLYRMCKAAGRHVWANCESFDWIGNLNARNFNGEGKYLTARYLGGGMVGAKGFDKQLEVARPFTEKMCTFMLNGFFAPPGMKPVCGGAPALKQYSDYVAYREKMLKR